MKQYEQSVPGQMCRFWFDLCINATGSNLAEQFQCQQSRDTQCGNLTTKAAESSSASTSGGPSRTSGGGDSPSSTAGGAGASQSSGAAALAFAREYGTPALAGGMIALFGLAL